MAATAGAVALEVEFADDRSGAVLEATGATDTAGVAAPADEATELVAVGLDCAAALRDAWLSAAAVG